MTIPEIREILEFLAADWGKPELKAIADELKRRPAVRRAPRKIPSITPEQARAINSYASTHPTKSYEEMAQHFHVNIGRISEVLAGFRQ